MNDVLTRYRPARLGWPPRRRRHRDRHDRGGLLPRDLRRPRELRPGLHEPHAAAGGRRRRRPSPSRQHPVASSAAPSDSVLVPSRRSTRRASRSTRPASPSTASTRATRAARPASACRRPTFQQNVDDDSARSRASSPTRSRTSPASRTRRSTWRCRSRRCSSPTRSRRPRRCSSTLSGGRLRRRRRPRRCSASSPNAVSGLTPRTSSSPTRRRRS